MSAHDIVKKALRGWKNIPRPWIDRCMENGGTVSIDEWCAKVDAMDEALAVLESHVVVPREPSEGILAAMEKAILLNSFSENAATDAYQAIIDEASPPAKGAG